MIYHIPEGNIPEFEKRMARLVKAATKVNSRLEYLVDRTSFQDKEYTVEVEGKPEKRYCRCIKVTVDGDKPKIAGWTFIGTLEHTEEGNVLRLVPDQTCPESYRTAEPFCEHCRLQRTRKDTYVVHHDNGEFKQVGRNCLKDFLGHENPQWLAQLAEIWIKLNDLCDLAEDETWLGGGGNYITKERYDLLMYLSFVCAVIRVDKRFITRKQAQEWDKDPTSYIAQRAMLPSRNRHDMDHAVTYAPIDDDKQLAEAARNWTLRQYGVGIMDAGEAASVQDVQDSLLDSLSGLPEGLSDFDHNMIVVAKGESVERRTFGIAAYLVQNYRIKNNLIVSTRKTYPASNYVGAVKDRMRDVEVEVEAVKTWNSEQFGECSLFKLRDPSGNLIVWKTYNVGIENSMVEGHKYVIDATVKKHAEFRGEKQTVVSRLAVKLGAVKTTLPVAQAA